MTETSLTYASTPADTDAGPGRRVVLRTIMRPDIELDVRPLYVTGASSFAAGGRTGQSGDVETGSSGKRDEDRSSTRVDETQVRVQVDNDGSTTVGANRRVSFGTYFNAFPASYWRRWTDFESVRLSATLHGQGTFIVYRSTARGDVIRAASRTIESAEPVPVELDLPLKPFIDGGWYWFELEAGDRPLTLEESHWSVATDRTTVGSVTIGITTFNRPDFCVAQLRNLASTPAVLDIIDEIIVVDQGTQKVVDDEGFDDAAAGLGAKLRVIDQANVGGSGGFSRAMHEAASKGVSDYVLLLDDDVVCELEGILRAVTFADLAKGPTLVGGHMFSLYARTVLHALGEALAPYRWFWGPAPGTKRSHDFSEQSLRSTPWLHRRVDVDYNGWWMCLIPVEVVRKIGLSMPMFIKWDDAEYGLRAKEAGYPTVSLPGAAVWHVPWTEKDDTIDWQAYFHERNRLVSALLHSPYPRGGKLLRESMQTVVKHCVSMQYSAAEMVLMAISDVLEGPERMHHDMVHRLAELRELRQQYTDSVNRPELDQFPTPRRSKPPRKGRDVVQPSGPIGYAGTFAVGMLRQLRGVRPLSRRHPEAQVPAPDARWWRLIQLDSALVSAADGSAASWYQRKPEEFRQLMERGVALHSRLVREWPRLSRQYRAALDDITSPDAWASSFTGEA